jgi:hypothetical protein
VSRMLNREFKFEVQQNIVFRFSPRERNALSTR